MGDSSAAGSDGQAEAEAGTDPELEELRNQRAAIKAANEEKLAKLVRAGAHIDPVGIVMTRLQCLIDCAFGDPKQTESFEIMFEQRIGETLDNTLREADRMKLTLPPGFKRD